MAKTTRPDTDPIGNPCAGMGYPPYHAWLEQLLRPNKEGLSKNKRTIRRLICMTPGMAKQAVCS